MCRLFGMSAVKDEAEIDMVINLEQWKDGAMYDRLGLENLYTTILDVQVPSLTVPVRCESERRDSGGGREPDHLAYQRQHGSGDPGRGGL